MNNICKFGSQQEFDAARAKDGWGYPNISLIVNNDDRQLKYNNEFIMRWYDNDSSKQPHFYGDVSWTAFKSWVDGACFPCEVSKSTGEVTYLSGSALATAANRENPDYLQMVELKNINVGLFQNPSEGWKEVRFNLDLGCPQGFHKWFAHPYWNISKGAYTKLFGRYDIIHNADGTTVDVCAGRPQAETANGANWSANLMLQKIKATKTATGLDLLAGTYWEYLVLAYIFCAYHNNFNVQSIYNGLSSGGNSNGDQFVKGLTDTITSHTGQLGANQAYKFMHIENAIHGSQWIWGAGWVGNSGTNPTGYWMTFDDIKANKSATMSKADADVSGSYPYNQEGAYITKIDLYGVPTATSGSSSSGFYDGMWSNGLADSRVAYLGGRSDFGAACGAFARTFGDDASASSWLRRGRLSMNR